eukprot:gene10799-22544_t
MRFIWSSFLLVSVKSLLSSSTLKPKCDSKKPIQVISHSHFDTLQCLSTIEFNVLRSAAAGSLAGGLRALSRGLTFPFDSMKTFEQAKMNGGKQRTIGEYFRGVIPTVATAVPANALFFMTYDYLMAIAPCIAPHTTALGLLEQRLLVSAIATIPQNAIKIPAELIKQRAQVQSESDFQLLFNQITAKRGLIGLYLGGGAQLLREIPYNSLQMASFAALQEYSVSYKIPLDPPLIAAVLGLLAAAFAALLTQPADVVKTRIMTDLEQTIDNVVVECDEDLLLQTPITPIPRTTSSTTSPDSPSQSQLQSWWMQSSVIREGVAVVREEGVAGLFSGLVPRLLLVSIGGMVYFWAAAISEAYFDTLS